MAQTGPRDKATIEALRERMARDPLSRAFLQLAEEYRRAGRFEEAVAVCREGLARHPGYHTARIALGRTYLDAGDLDGAHQALTEVLDAMPENHLAAKLLGEVQVRLGNQSGAAETYRAILHHYPGDREVEGLLQGLGGVGGIATRGSAAEAPRSEVAAPATPTVAEAQRREAWTSVPLPPVEGAAAAGAEVDALQTNTLAELYLRQGLVEKALEVYRAMLRVDPANERARRRLLELEEDRTPSTADRLEPPPAFATDRPGVADPVDEPRAEPLRADPLPPGGPPPVAAFPAGDGPRGDGVAMEAAVGHPAAADRRGQTIDRLGRWLVTIRSGPPSAGRESRP
jgi:pentatricopeptide repeat protein